MLINFQLIIFLSLIKIIAMEKLAKFCLLLTSFRLKQIYSDKKNVRKINRCWFLFTIKLIPTFYYLIKIKVLHHHVLVVMISSSGLWRYQLVDDDSIIFSIEICDNSALPFPINFLFYFNFYRWINSEYQNSPHWKLRSSCFLTTKNLTLSLSTWVPF